MTKPAPGAVCKTCNNTYAWHQHNPTQHAYNDGSIPTSQTFGTRLPDGTRTPVAGLSQTGSTNDEAPWPFDPVLRQALIDKGVLTPDDLIDAERKIRMITNQFNTGAGAKS